MQIAEETRGISPSGSATGDNPDEGESAGGKRPGRLQQLLKAKEQQKRPELGGPASMQMDMTKQRNMKGHW